MTGMHIKSLQYSSGCEMWASTWTIFPRERFGYGSYFWRRVWVGTLRRAASTLCEKLQGPDLLAHPQLQDLLQDVLSLALLHDAHPLQFSVRQSHESPPWRETTNKAVKIASRSQREFNMHSRGLCAQAGAETQSKRSDNWLKSISRLQHCCWHKKTLLFLRAFVYYVIRTFVYYVNVNYSALAIKPGSAQCEGYSSKTQLAFHKYQCSTFLE